MNELKIFEGHEVEVFELNGHPTIEQRWRKVPHRKRSLQAGIQKPQAECRKAVY